MLFQLCVELNEVPVQWKTAEIIPVPKKRSPTSLNDYRPIALTSLLMKSFERILLKYMLPQIEHLLDPLQFAYRSKRSVEDATLSMLNVIYDHLDRPGSYARILFVDFSSAFNTIQPHLMIRKLIDLGVSKPFIKIVHSFLTNRSQYVNVKGHCSPRVSISTGAPQGCVLSPFLYALYTNSCRSTYTGCHCFKYADDTALVGLITNDEADYISSVDHFTTWCSDNCLEINVSKTKEMIIDFRSGVHHPNPVNVMGQNIEIVHSYKYLGTIIDDKLRWDENTTNLYKKGQQRLYFLRKLNALHVDRNILSLFHDSFVKSVMTFGLICWWGNLSVKNRAKLSKLHTISCKIVGCSTPDSSLQKLYNMRTIQMAKKIISDPTHFLHAKYDLLPSGRRHRMPAVRTQRAMKSFIPSSIKLLNH